MNTYQKIGIGSFLYLMCLAFFMCDTNAYCQTWTKRMDIPDLNGKGRWGAFSFSLNSHIYVGGGYVGNFINRNDLWEYDPNMDNWTRRNDVPGGNGRTHAIAFQINGKGYVGLGEENFNSTSAAFLKDLWEYDAVLDQWKKMADLPDSGRSQSTCFVVNNKAYIVGGRTDFGKNSSDVWEYDPIGNTWLSKHVYPVPIRFAQSFATGNTGFIAGGISDTITLTTTYRYDALADSWIQKANYCMDGRHGGIAFSLNGMGYVGLGLAKTPTHNSAYKEFCKYDTLADTWLPSDSYPQPDRSYAVANIANGRAFAGGGFIFNGVETYFTDWYMYDPQPLKVLDAKRENSFSVYPQPASSFLKVHFATKRPLPCFYTISDISGKAIVSECLLDSDTIDIKNLESGTYILKVHGDVVRVVIMK